jgi:hypothetical protein
MFRAGDKDLKYYDKNFYLNQSPWRGDYFRIAEWINKNIKGDVFGDVGCGEGYLIEDLHKKFGKEVWGVDGSAVFQEFVDASIKDNTDIVDLTKRHRLNKADVAISLEVGEHLPFKSSGIFVKNITSTRAKTIVFTAAPPGQEGVNHINLQPPSFWEEKFKKKGYKLNPILTKKFKTDLKKNLEHTYWYVNNIMILGKT